MLKIRFLTLFSLLMALTIFISCKDNGTDNDDSSSSEIKTFVSKNIKTEGKQYFSFADNSASETKPEKWDLTLQLNSRTVQVIPNNCKYFEVGANPAIIGAPGISLAKTSAASLDDAAELPDPDGFVEDDTLREAFIGKKWFDPQNHYSVKPDVYVIKNCAGNFALLQVKRFDFDPTKYQISNIYFDYKYNSDGSLDFSNAALDSAESGNAYDKSRYFSFSGQFLDSGFGTWDIKFIGSSIWMGPNVQVKKLENTDINDITTVTDAAFNFDHLPSITTDDWYNTDETHHVIPKDYVYFVHTSDNKYAAFEVTNYYDEQGNSGVYTIKWKYMTP
jgi:hypothetical protein